LKTWLEDMGLDPQQDGVAYKVEISGFWLWVELSPDGTVLWISTNVAKFADPAQAPVAKLLALMETNGYHGHFSYTSKYQIVSFQNAMPNSGITRSMLRRALDSAADKLDATSSIWRELGWAE
jgi:hypothetical protein